jgi:hydroxypyruvate isomerase
VSFRLDATLPAIFDCDRLEAIERTAAAGLDGFEFYDWESADLPAVTRAADEHGLDFAGTLAAGAGANIDEGDRAFLSDPDCHDVAVEDLTRSIEAAADAGAATVISTVGPNVDTLPDDAQHRAIVSAYREIAPVAERHGVTVVVEPLNRRVDHPGYYLDSSFEAYEIVQAVDSPNVQVLFDVYHQQITEGDVIRNVREHVADIGHIHIADNPGRNEPGTGELAYERVFEAIADAGYEGYVGCEFSPTRDPDAVLAEVATMADRVR